MEVNKTRALILGCGNIGAGYDLHDQSGRVWTHAKAFYINGNFDVDVADQDFEKAKEVAGIYNFTAVELKSIKYSDYSLVSIATPTADHFKSLSLVMEAGVPVVICEKPVSDSTSNIDTLLKKRSSTGTKVLVNYMRRFQPAFADLRHWLSDKSKTGNLSGINIEYCRGFLNNGSHALDLIEFLFGSTVDLTAFNVISSEFDAFPKDPTLSGGFRFENAPAQMLGLAATDYRLFNITLYFQKVRIEIANSGDTIRYFSPDSAGNLALEKTVEGILHSYMVPVLARAQSMLTDKVLEDNMESAALLNKKMLTVIK